VCAGGGAPRVLTVRLVPGRVRALGRGLSRPGMLRGRADPAAGQLDGGGSRSLTLWSIRRYRRAELESADGRLLVFYLALGRVMAWVRVDRSPDRRSG
jgi:hypothetical protein